MRSEQASRRWPPNTRVQRTRCRSPLTRKSLGGIDSHLGRIASALVLLTLRPITTAPRIDSPSAEQKIFASCIHERLKSTSEGIGGDYLVVQSSTIVFCAEPDRKAAKDGCYYHEADQIRESGKDRRLPGDLVKALLASDRYPVEVPKNDGAKLVSAADISRIFKSKGWWDEFYKRYPGSKGFLRFAEPVFSPDGNRALLYVSHSCGGLCGSGWLVLLSREGAAWHIEYQKMLWIS